MLLRQLVTRGSEKDFVYARTGRFSKDARDFESAGTREADKGLLHLTTGAELF